MLPKLYACMMIRNESHNLDRCLSSIKSVCDAIIVVDTGSTDDSVGIARKYGATVYPSTFNWRVSPRFDFSLGRNEGLQYCKELGADWVVVIDGDEELKDIEVTPEEFKLRLSQLPDNVHALATQVHENKNGVFTLSFWGTRFFRMASEVIYEGICHNRPKLYEGMFVGASNITIYHYGYSDEVVMEKKRVRTLALLDKRIRDKPDDYEAYYYKCMTLLGQDDFNGGIEAGEKCLEILIPQIDDDPYELSLYGVLYYAIGWAYFRKWQKENDDMAGTRAYQWWMHGWELWPDDIDLNFQLCTIGYLSQNAEMIRNHGERYLKGLDKYHIELDMPVKNFVTPFDMNSLALGKRHVHHATPKHEGMIREIMRKAA